MKTVNTHTKTDQGGFALLVVLFFIASISTFLAMLAFSSSQRAYTARRLTEGIKAQAMAEAGCEYGYAILSTDWDARYDLSAFSSSDSGSSSLSSTPDASFSSMEDANYQITVEPIGELSALVTTTGTCGSASVVSIVSVQNIGGSDDDGDVLSGQAFEYAILCGGEFDFSGCGTIISPSGNAKFHANGNMFLRGTTDALINLSSSTMMNINNNVTVGGDITAPDWGGTKWNKVSVDGTKTTETVPIVEIPDIDLTPYYNWALKHGEVTNSVHISSSYAPRGGILWINGNVMIDSHAVISGSIIATGDIMISGQADVSPTETAFALASRDGNVVITSSGTITGLIYAKTGGLQYTANGNIAGQIIVNGDIKKAGNSDIMTSFATYVPSPPAGSVTTDYIAITAWQK